MRGGFYRLLLVSVALAVVSNVAAESFGFNPVIFTAVCALLCTVLLIWALISYRWKGLWLLLPLAATPLWLVLFGISLAQCAATRGSNACLP